MLLLLNIAHVAADLFGDPYTHIWRWRRLHFHLWQKLLLCL